MRLGNIIYSEELVNHISVDYINYIDIKDFDDISKYNKFMPTLVVGYENFKTLYSREYPDSSILEKEVIPNRLYWEFSFSENKKQSIDGINQFATIDVINYYYFAWKYYIIDPIFYKIKTETDLFNQFNKIHSLYMDNRMIYLIANGGIYGIDKDLYQFLGFNIDLIVDHLYNKAIRKINDIDLNIYKNYRKTFPEFTFIKRYIPLFELSK